MSKSTKFIYPLTVQSVLYANYKSTTNGTWQTNYNNYLWNVTNESMNVTNTDNTGTVNVVALVIGIAQQWGYITNHLATTKVSFPYKFSTACYSMSFGIVYNNTQYSYDQVISFDTSGFYTYHNINDSISVMWFATGKQRSGVLIFLQ